ncbi:unnamed protein product [Medioppia subpectinata]|uniref:3',5'-cyclic-GMP phosphodiesterase n=1 Tax=Medioppia subpectinata TaxID=1979941 RepID=A0A7R9KVR3_9ACAR|nr:unnamed protein product [Medioppia subpectinata]CAG2110617.1 unnamed protein product [Medioppia subpectinata]
MCQPILNFSGDVIGVAQCINKTNNSSQQSFTRRDEQVFQKYLTFCGIGLQNAQLFEMSINEYKRNQLLLSLARSIFQETSSLDALIKKIMTRAQGLLQSDKCRVYLVDIEGQQFHEEYCETMRLHMNIGQQVNKQLSPDDLMFSTIFELKMGSNEILKLSEMSEFESMIDGSHVSYARQVASVGQTYKCNDKSGKSETSDRIIRTFAKERPGIVLTDNENDCVLSVPIFNNESKVIGVSQLVKTKGQQFNDVDISTLEAFSIFCGFGIHNSCLYEKALKLTAKQKVALEVLSYHASASIDETKKLMNLAIPDANAYQLYSFEFSDFGLDERDTCSATLRMFLELKLNNTFKIPYQILCRWILSVKKNYRPVTYHNWRHALNVTQTIRQNSQTNTLCDNWSSKKSCIEIQTSDTKSLTTNDEELLTASYKQIAKEGRNSVTSDLFHQFVECNSRKTKSVIKTTDDKVTRDELEDRLRDLDEVDLFMKLISDITNELDINTLCHKILVNVSILTKSDRGSLFLAKGSRDDRYLEAKLFDVTSDSLLKDALNAAKQYTNIPLPFVLRLEIENEEYWSKQNLNTFYCFP